MHNRCILHWNPSYLRMRRNALENERDIKTLPSEEKYQTVSRVT